ncbi:hypothetical protein BGX27_004744, partial [Mortierella sp. AM989]
MIRVPVRVETVETARKSLIYLWRQQNARTSPYPNPAPNPRNNIPLKDAIAEYETRLIYARSAAGTVRTTACSIRDPYSATLFLRMISFTWRMLAPLRQKGRRSYNANNRFQLASGILLFVGEFMKLKEADWRKLVDTLLLQ